MQECHFWADVMLIQSRLRDSRASSSSAQKQQGLRVVCSKNFSRATFFCFLGHFFAGLFEQFALETNLMKQRSVSQSFAKIFSVGFSRIQSVHEKHQSKPIKTQLWFTQNENIVRFFVSHVFMHFKQARHCTQMDFGHIFSTCYLK